MTVHIIALVEARNMTILNQLLELASSKISHITDTLKNALNTS